MQISTDMPFSEKIERQLIAERVPIEQVVPNSNQPRKRLNEESIRELALDITAHGMLHPITVRSIENTTAYEIVCGERRWRAAKIAGFTEVPVIIKELEDNWTFDKGVPSPKPTINLNAQ